jgi:hypothetical protein
MRAKTLMSVVLGLALAGFQASAMPASGAASPSTLPGAQAAAGGAEISASAASTLPGMTAAITDFNPHGFPFPVGIYRCDLNRSVDVREVAHDMRTATVRWNKKDYVLRAVTARSGALRYEDPASGLVWIVVVGKSMLLDTKQGRQLANDCRV